MKLFCFLITFWFVNVSTNDTENYTRLNYMKDVNVTNAHIKLASNKIHKRNNIDTNGLEHIIIKIIGNNDKYSLGVMNMMFATPEKDLLYNLSELEKMQSDLRKEIELELEIPVPQVPHLFFKNYMEVMEELGKERRVLTAVAVKNIWDKAIEPPELELLWMCRLSAIFMSIRFPSLYIQKIQTDKSAGICTTVNANSTKDTYKRIEEKWCQISVVVPLQKSR
ncbi:uncharacterized protein LOC126846838 isoform X1 [Adelges cooleyi]|uniref:uncharacterized protein LOC126846838 isoform X1 n=1 Tax=Adelges cooleyi TaxID=133065 RepID=UPI0021809145|nr:uncharacterized protein LOC126846838 isoform X1 [Adelges cooleyi]